MRGTLMILILSTAAGAEAPNGAALFSKRCAGCHGEDGKANTRNGKKYEIADFTAAGWAKDWTLDKIEHNVATGVKGKMPAFQDKLSVAEIEATSKRVLELAQPAPAAKAADAPKAP